MARHSNKEIEAALDYAREQGWDVIKSLRGHCWGMIRCPHGRGGCQKSVWSTPQARRTTPNRFVALSITARIRKNLEPMNEGVHVYLDSLRNLRVDA